MPDTRSAFRSGMLAIAPVLLGAIPFGLIAGVAAADAGIGAPAGVAMSALLFAGASQLAALDLIAADATAFAVVATALVINARMVMYSASLAPYLQGAARRTRVGLAFFLTDQSYAVSLLEFAARPGTLPTRIAFYLGTALPLYLVWVGCTLLGVLAGAGLPDTWELDFGVPLVFLALLVPSLRDRSGAVAAVVGGTVAVLAAGLPSNLGLLSGAVAGIAAGVAAERWRR